MRCDTGDRIDHLAFRGITEVTPTEYAEIDQACREYFTKLIARAKETKGQVQYRILMGRGMLGNSRSFWKYLVKRGARHG
jgi:hypothetical protein